MSYAITLGANLSASASAAATITTRGAASSSTSSTSTSTPAAPAPAPPKIPTSIPDCRDAAITGGDSKLIDDVFVDCCQKIKGGSGTIAQKTKGIAACAAKNTARGVGAVVGTTAGIAICSATGVGAVAAPLCGMVGGAIGTVVGGFVYERVAGWDTTQIVGGLAAGAVCAAVSGGIAGPLCAFAAAELIGWLSDSVGPVIEGIFNPGAAREREMAARRGEAAAIKATADATWKADEEYRLCWVSGVSSIKALYRKAFPTAALQQKARQQLGFGPVYDEVAKALVNAGALAAPTGLIAEFLKNQKASGDPGCASNDTLTNGKWDPYSEVCPFSLHRLYLQLERNALAAGLLKSRDQRIEFEKQTGAYLVSIAQNIYPLIVRAVAVVTTQITMVATVLKQQELLTAAQNATKEQLAVRVAKAASRAEVAADAAAKGSAAEGKRAVRTAAEQYDIANAAFNKLLVDHFGGATSDVKQFVVQAAKCAADTYCARAMSDMKRAKKAKDAAVVNAERAARNRVLIGGAVAAGAVGAAYLLTR